MTIGLGCLEQQYRMNIECFESDVPHMCRFNVLPTNCTASRLHPDTLPMFQQRKERILCTRNPYGSPISASLCLYSFWNGATLDGIAQLVLFKSRDDAQSFLEKDFRQRCERSRRAVANRDNTDQQREWALADHLANLQGFSATLLPTKSLIENEIDDVEEQLKSIKEWNQHHR